MDQLLFKINGLAYTYNFHWDGYRLTISLDLKGKDYQVTGNPCLKNFGYCTFMYNACFLSPNVLFLIFWTMVAVGSWAWKFCYHPLLLLKICLLLWAALLFMHCSCMLMEERSIHRLILQYFATVSNYK